MINNSKILQDNNLTNNLNTTQIVFKTLTIMYLLLLISIKIKVLVEIMIIKMAMIDSLINHLSHINLEIIAKIIKEKDLIKTKLYLKEIGEIKEMINQFMFLR